VIYRLPFAAGKRVTVTQGYGGKATHRGASTYAVDFEASVGTPIYAARAGTVVAVESGHNRSGYDKSYSRFANYILIEHADHTFAEYAHLMQRGVTVGIGRKVRAGELIGYSGNTGYTNGPHLHFEVLKVESAVTGSTVSLPVRMRSGGNIVTHPKKGDSYTVNVSQ
jgi:murein DD-endopeptidase MepM/ murein hydrolase activator NlpD